jgi:hypothetical protein
VTLSAPARTFDTADEALEACFELGWTDGLPVVPATTEAVSAMLARGGLDPEEVLGTVPTRNVTVTAEKAAINAVMAGCLPEYFPVVVAAVRAHLQTKANSHSTTATLAGAAHAVIVNGPVRHEIGIQSGQACFGPGFRANATIGRALRLVIRNVCRAIPGELDRASFSWPLRYSFCFGEDEEGSDWTPMSVERGLPAGASAVTVASMMTMGSATDFFSRTPEGVTASIARAIRQRGTAGDEWLGDDTNLVVVIGPEHRRYYLEAGWSKADIRAAMWPLLMAPKEPGEGMVKLAKPEGLLLVAAGGPGMAESWIIFPHLAWAMTELVASV